MAYCPPLLRDHYTDRLLNDLPEGHKKAIIAAHVAARLVYTRGVDWSPSIVDILPVIWQDPALGLE